MEGGPHSADGSVVLAGGRRSAGRPSRCVASLCAAKCGAAFGVGGGLGKWKVGTRSLVLYKIVGRTVWLRVIMIVIFEHR